jgi:anti-anti-sigma factor
VSTYELEHLESDDEGVAVIALVGELDLTHVSTLERRLEREVERDLPLVVDLNRVVFVDSAALHCFFRLARARGRSRLAIVVEPTAPIARALDIVDLDRAATIVPTMADARAALSSAQPT